jgi:DNA-binding LacI/PurR family transcriptional regulator
MAAAGLSTEGLAFHPQESDSPKAIRQVGRVLAGLLKQQANITAIVAANDQTALMVLDGINAGGVARDKWPAIVGFDNLASAQGQVLTSLRLPQEELGRTAADLLWERRHGLLTGPPVHRRAHMSLLPRLSCRSGWSSTVGLPVIASATLT